MPDQPDRKCRTIRFKTPASGDPLEVVVYSPAVRNESPVPCVVFFFGGGWVGGDNRQFSPQAEYVARRGVVGITAQYRTHGSHGVAPRVCVADGRSAMRWVRTHADELGVDPERIVAAGGSAGGHVAACTALLEGFDDPTDDLSVSCRPGHLVLFNPVVDTTEAGFGAALVGEDKQALSPVHHIRPGAVPTLILHGTADATVPYENVERFTALMAEAGNHCTLIPFEGRKHGFFNNPARGHPQGSEQDFEATMHEMDRWLVGKGILKGAPLGEAVFPTAPFPGAVETTPSRAQYFSWINNTNEGATEKQTLINLAFFEWLYTEYGMQLDIYAFDAGAIDGCGFYGSTQSGRFKRQFPGGFAPLVAAAARCGCRLGIWGGPDGFGDTEAEARARIETMVSLCRDHNFMLFKFDAVCGHLRPEKVKYFVEMMTECRKHAPDLILLNHRLELGSGLPHATTFLWEGREMYTDVNMVNPIPGTHNRVGDIGRGLPPELKRLTEDHGVCISSCVDYWEDALIQQAFNRCLILAPEIYGNPWLMRDDEFPRLARIYNLHRRYRDILVHGVILPEAVYGEDAVSRGNGVTRFLSLRNLTWERITIPVTLDATLGLDPAERVEVRRMHPFETVLGEFAWGRTVDVVVEPFRACLVMAVSGANREMGFHGCDGEIVKDKPGEAAELKLWGLPGTAATVRIVARGYGAAALEGEPADALLADEGLTVCFDGKPLRDHWHRKLGDLAPAELPTDAEALYQSTCYAADSNALEVRELERAGPSRHIAVQNARDAFFDQETFKKRGLWDRNLFDNDPDSFFAVCRRYRDLRVRRGCFRLDFGAAVQVDQLVLETKDDYHMQPLRNHEAVAGWVSPDLKHWTPVQGMAEGDIHFTIKGGEPVRYFRMNNCPDRINEVRGFYRGEPLVRHAWRASNLFAATFPATSAWTITVTVEEIHEGSYLVIPVFGPHVPEAVYAAARCGDAYLGAARRAPSYPSNVFEQCVRPGQNYTYFIPLAKAHEGRPVEVWLLGLADSAQDDLSGEVWITAHPTPHIAKTVILRPTESSEGMPAL